MTLHDRTCTDKYSDKIFSTKGVCEKTMTLCETCGKEDDWKSALIGIIYPRKSYEDKVTRMFSL